MNYEAVIGLEVHVQLLTKSKMFCRCAADYSSAEPNTHVCPTCLGMPGVLPVINQMALKYVVMTALALNCTISELSRFDRKNYPYPDLMKGYQISQYHEPLAQKGWVMVKVNEQGRRIGITRVHLEEDTAKLSHCTNALGESYSLVDVNRSGVPLMEVVSEPDLRSPEEARQYLMELRNSLRYLGVSTGNMEEGSFRCDANVSIRPLGSKEYYPKVEIKNMNSFKAVYRALGYEIQRQQEVVEGDGRIAQETRGWVEEREVTAPQRSKEYAHDYRYFPEPDLPPLVLSRDWIEAIRSQLPELPDARRKRLMTQYNLGQYDADLLTGSKEMATYFEASLAGKKNARTEDLCRRAKTASNWILGDLLRLLNATDTKIQASKLTPAHLAEMLDLIERGKISSKIAKTVFEKMFRTGKSASQVVTAQGLVQISDTSTLEEVAKRSLEKNPQAVLDYRAGKPQALTFLVGQVMKETKGQANPALVNQILRTNLGEG